MFLSWSVLLYWFMSGAASPEVYTFLQKVCVTKHQACPHSPSLSSSRDAGTRFRPLSFQVPKPLFPIAGCPMVQHQIEACTKLPECKEVFLLGYFQPLQELKKFLQAVQKDYNISVR